MLPEPHDYPAAHSMDTTWFAVDRDGFVAEFYSGESGAVPAEAASENKGITLEKVLAGLPEIGFPGTPVTTEAARHGLYTYLHPELGLVAEAYVRRCRPPEPVTLDQLPEAVRVAVGMVRFDLSFGEAQSIHPVELVEECFAWRSAYLNSKQTTLRAIPGHEELYELEYAELCEDYPEYTVEPPPAASQE